MQGFHLVSEAPSTEATRHAARPRSPSPQQHLIGITRRGADRKRIVEGLQVIAEVHNSRAQILVQEPTLLHVGARDHIGALGQHPSQNCVCGCSPRLIWDAAELAHQATVDDKVVSLPTRVSPP